MTSDDHDAAVEVEVVLWRPGGGATAVLPEAVRTLTIRFDDEHALASAAAEVRERTGMSVAILALSRTQLHLELQDPAGPDVVWRDPVAAIDADAPWNRPGWFVETKERIRGALVRAVGAGDVGPFRQVKHWSISALIEVGTDRGTYWYKQVPAFMAHEAALTAWVAAVRPGVVLDVVACGEAWYLAAAFDRPTEERTLDSPYGVLAELQVAAAGRTDELLALGCPDRRSPTMVDDLRALAARDDLLDAATAARLHEAMPRVEELVARLEASPVPSSLVHGDLHAGNWTRRGDGSWLVFDWTDGCVAHPFLDLGVLPRKDGELRDARLAAYLEPWREAIGDAAVAATLEAALPLAGAFQALSYQRIVDGVDAADAASWQPAIASHLGRLLDG